MKNLQQAHAAGKNPNCEVADYSLGLGSLAAKFSSTFAPSGS
jgi:hypothetical protein